MLKDEVNRIIYNKVNEINNREEIEYVLEKTKQLIDTGTPPLLLLRLLYLEKVFAVCEIDHKLLESSTTELEIEIIKYINHRMEEQD